MGEVEGGEAVEVEGAGEHGEAGHRLVAVHERAAQGLEPEIPREARGGVREAGEELGGEGGAGAEARAAEGGGGAGGRGRGGGGGLGAAEEEGGAALGEGVAAVEDEEGAAEAEAHEEEEEGGGEGAEGARGGEALARGVEGGVEEGVVGARRDFVWGGDVAAGAAGVDPDRRKQAQKRGRGDVELEYVDSVRIDCKCAKNWGRSLLFKGQATS